MSGPLRGEGGLTHTVVSEVDFAVFSASHVSIRNKNVDAKHILCIHRLDIFADNIYHE